MKIYDSADIARQYKITKTAADMYTQLKRISWVSSQNGDRYRDRDGYYCYISRAKLAEMIGRSEATAARCTRQLVSAGLIKVKRTKHIHKIYVLDVVMPGKNDTTQQIKNDTSISKYKSEHNINGSINPVKMSAGYETSDSISSAVERCHEYAAQPAAEGERQNSQDKPAAETQPTRQRTHVRKPRITKEVKQKARERYYAMMADRLGLSNSDWCMFQDEHARMKALVSIVADALSVPSRQFRINGRNVTTSEYWRVVQSMTLESMASIPDRVEEYRLSSGIRNINAYVLACVFNECQYQNLIKGASPSIA